MSNGRRRWRKWAAKQRQWVRRVSGCRLGDVRMKKSVKYPDDLYNGMWVSLHGEDGQIQALPPRPWSPRSLVGMTMGARKRAADRAAISREDYQFTQRPMFRIGERLRPCPGCGRDSSRYIGPGICCDGSGTVPARKAKR